MRLERWEGPFGLQRGSFEVRRALGVVRAMQKGALIAECKCDVIA